LLLQFLDHKQNIDRNEMKKGRMERQTDRKWKKRKTFLKSRQEKSITRQSSVSSEKERA